MYEIEVRNVASIDHARFGLVPGINLLAGLNEQGKSTLALLIGSLMAGTATPRTGKQTHDAQLLIRNGTGEASASLKVEGAARALRWKGNKAEMSEAGDPARLPNVGRVAACLSRWSELIPDQRRTIAAQVWKANPNPDDVLEALKEAGVTVLDAKGETPIPAGHVTIDHRTWVQIASYVQDGMWADAEKVAKEAVSFATKTWERATGEKYGSQKAEGWMPEGWEGDLHNYPAEAEPGEIHQEAGDGTLATVWQAAKRAHDAVEARARVETPEFLQAEKVGERVQELTAEMKRRSEDYFKVKGEHEALEGEAVRAEHRSKTLTCPCCAKPLVYAAGRLYEPKEGEVPSEADVAAVVAKRDEVGKLLDEQQKLFDATKARLEEAKAAWRMTSTARETLAKLGDAPSLTLEDAKAAVERAERRFNAHRDYHAAQRAHRDAVRWSAVAKVLAPAGVRATKLTKVRTQIEKDIGKFVDAVLGKKLGLDDDWSFLLDGVHWLGTSGSQRWTLDAAAALAIAEKKREPIVILDAPTSGADVLMPGLRGALFNMLADLETVPTIVVTMSVPDRAKAPDFAKMGIGQTIFVSDGAVEVIGADAPEQKKAA